MKKQCSKSRLRRFITIFLVFQIIIFSQIVGCVSHNLTFKATPPIQVSSNDYFDTKLRSKCYLTCFAFDIEIENKTDEEIEILWEKTLYISNGKRYGRFSFKNTAYAVMNEEEMPMLPPETVPGKGKMHKRILPNSLVHFTGGSIGKWRRLNMPAGENGVYLVVKIGEKEINEIITVDVTHEST